MSVHSLNISEVQIGDKFASARVIQTTVISVHPAKYLVVLDNGAEIRGNADTKVRVTVIDPWAEEGFKEFRWCRICKAPDHHLRSCEWEDEVVNQGFPPPEMPPCPRCKTNSKVYYRSPINDLSSYVCTRCDSSFLP